MCLILFALDPSDALTLVVAANRDEFHDRPALPASYWRDRPDLFAGRDEKMGGTWLGVTRKGRFAAVTNFQQAPANLPPPRSRGELPVAFLAADDGPVDHLAKVAEGRNNYRGFNLLVFDGVSLGYYCNRSGEHRILAPGSYGLSNRALDCDWPKVVEGREAMDRILRDHRDHLADALFELLTCEGDGRDFSGSFIRSDHYGTRAATLVIMEKSGAIHFEERSYGKDGRPAGSVKQVIRPGACS